MSTISPSGHPLFQDPTQIVTRKMGKFTLRFRPYTLELRYVFTVAAASRSTTPVVLTELEYEGCSVMARLPCRPIWVSPTPLSWSF